MAFGPIMRFAVGEFNVELAPLTKATVGEIIVDGGMQSHHVTQFLGRRTAPVLEDEHEWFEKMRTQKDSVVWGIWLVTDERKLIGVSSLHGIAGDHFLQATSGSQIFRREYWGKGIGGACHRARTWYGFTHLGLTRIKSAVIVGNLASQRALERCGYSHVCIERNEMFVNGAFHDKLCLECLNPDPQFWKRWWGASRPTKASLDARTRTRDALAWAETNVTFG